MKTQERETGGRKQRDGISWRKQLDGNSERQGAGSKQEEDICNGEVIFVACSRTE